MSRIKDLGQLKKPELKEIVLDILPDTIQMSAYALEKGYKVNELVRKVHKKSYEWYGFLVGPRGFPEVVSDMILGETEANERDYVSISAESIQRALSSLQKDQIINGWIHSHGDLGYRQFSGMDYNNMIDVLGFVSPITQRPIAKKELSIKDLSLLVEGHGDDALRKGVVTAVSDKKIERLKLFETVNGSYCFSIVIDDGGWHEHCITYERRGILSPVSEKTSILSPMDIFPSDKRLTEGEIADLEEQVRTKIKPVDPKKKAQELMAYLKNLGVDLGGFFK